MSGAAADRELIADMASRVFAEGCTPAAFEHCERGEWPGDLWEGLERSGLAAAADSGLALADLAAILRVHGACSVPAPLPEIFLAARMITAAGLPAQAGPLSVGPVLPDAALKLRRTARGHAVVNGRLRRLPWARHAQALAVLAESGEGLHTVVIAPPRGIVHGWNVAREPRDDLVLDDHPVADELVGPAGLGMSVE
ncbi:MAG: hypothetical protein GEU76_16765, partial [Alphaproteobacteria bacterium]|nr:hypothetical protein [Alphaproteobacteria bacterium]